jgi:single-strand DNA-binding protein
MAFNKVIINGNISTEVELKQTTNGKSVCSFNVAVNRNRLGSEEQKSDFFTVVAWAQKAEFVSKYFGKGKPILVCGRLENREWQDKNGNKRKSYSVVVQDFDFCGSKKDKASSGDSWEQFDEDDPFTP